MVERDDLALSLIKYLSGFTHFVILALTLEGACNVKLKTERVQGPELIANVSLTPACIVPRTQSWKEQKTRARP